VIQKIAGTTQIPISVDTSKAEVARQALEAGAHVINDVTSLRGDPAMLEVVRRHRAGVIIMHMQGTPATMQAAPQYQDVVAEVYAFLESRLQELQNAGLSAEQMAIDPGIGFGKTGAHNVALIANLERFRSLGRPICLGVSRKAFIGWITQRPVEERLAGSLAVLCHALNLQAVQIARVHDVRPTKDVIRIMEALSKSRGKSSSPAA
jgi:dihydropteroate synthase